MIRSHLAPFYEELEERWVFKGGFFFKHWIWRQINFASMDLYSAHMRRSDMIRRALDAPMFVDYSTYLQHGSDDPW